MPDRASQLDELERLLGRARVLDEVQRDAQLAKIEDDLSKEKDSRLKERFPWIVGFLVLLDLYFFPQMSSLGIFFIFLLELILLVPIAKWLGIQEVITVLDRASRLFRKDTTA